MSCASAVGRAVSGFGGVERDDRIQWGFRRQRSEEERNPAAHRIATLSWLLPTFEVSDRPRAKHGLTERLSVIDVLPMTAKLATATTPRDG
jgi:hypothetical protein